MGKKRTTASDAAEACIQFDDGALRLRLYRLDGGIVTIELTERRPPGRPIRQTINFEHRHEIERWLDAERLALERPLLYQALLRKLDEFWNEQQQRRQP